MPATPPRCRKPAGRYPGAVMNLAIIQSASVSARATLAGAVSEIATVPAGWFTTRPWRQHAGRPVQADQASGGRVAGFRPMSCTNDLAWCDVGVVLECE